ncbi:hypothetical protein Bca4012_026509 [Brassica carinata]|uniref:Transmembrane protein n=1 Tax=Brassica carinata TaxID=52824 RepID=A0A8X7VIE4_BRACI|nr:hypothetical protein Bca52824_023541 [Brassica carinata]
MERSPLRNVREEPREEGEIQIKENVLRSVQEEEEHITKPIPSSVAQPETNLAQTGPSEVDEEQVNMEGTWENEGIDNDFRNLMGGEEKDKSLDGASGFAEENNSIGNVDQLKKVEKLWEKFVIVDFLVSNVLISSLTIFGFLFISSFFIVGLPMLVSSLSKMKYWKKNGYYAYYYRFLALISDDTVCLCLLLLHRMDHSQQTISLSGFINPVTEIELRYYNGYGVLLHGGTGG